MRKYKSTFEEEQENTQHFIEKLQRFKSASKDIRRRSSLIQHKNIWRIQNQKYQDQEFKLTQEIYQISKQLDETYSQDIKQLFNDEEFNSFDDYNCFLDKQFKQFQNNFQFQLKNIKQIIPQLNPSQFEQLKALYNDLKLQFTPNEVPPIQNPISQEEEEDLMKIDFEFFDYNVFTDEKEIQTFQQYKNIMGLLEQTYELQNVQIQNDFQCQINQKFLDKEQFEKFKHIYNTYAKKGKEKEIYFEILKIVFPTINKKDLEEQDLYFREFEIIKSRKNAIKRDFLRQKLDIKQKTEIELNSLIQKRIQNSQNEQEKLQIQMKIYEQYQIRKDIFMRKVYEEEQKLQIKQRQKEEQELIKKEKNQKYYEKQKIITKEFQTKQEIQKQNELLEQKLIQEKQRQEKQINIMMNYNKVNSRQNFEEFKIQEKMLKKQYTKEQEIYRKQRLDDVVENYAIRPKVDKDFDRVQQHTQSHKAKHIVGMDKADKVNLFQNRGFTVDQLFSDIRYRLGAAIYVNYLLKDAGLAGNTYGHQILQGISKNPQ